MLPPNNDQRVQSSRPLFDLTDLVVEFGSGARAVKAVRGVSLAVHPGQTLGIVGESGSGKSVSLLASLGLLSADARVVSGTAFFDGVDLIGLPAGQRRELLGRDVGMVFQNPIASLNPVLSIGAQIGEALRIHSPGISRAAVRERAMELLTMVGITEPDRRIRQYPHQFSGGMCQRAMIAIALANQPKLLIADEPTTAVDVTIQAQLLKLLSAVGNRESNSSILVSHDLGVIAERTSHVTVMYGGLVMEEGPTREVLDRPQHPYTQGLLACRPRVDGNSRLEPIPGQPPMPEILGPGCPFQPRCPVGRDDELCRDTRPPLTEWQGRKVACHHAGTLAFTRHDEQVRSSAPAPEVLPLLEFRHGRVEFSLPRRRIAGRNRDAFAAVDDVDLAIRPGEAVGVVGESGSGKSTLARAMMRLLEPTSGSVLFDQEDVSTARRRALRPLRDRVQIVFQDPFTSMNPRLSAGDNAAEPLRLRKIPVAQRRQRVLERFAEVGLGEEHFTRPPYELSGGQLQRVGIARALVLDPDVLVLDEPVSSLDVSVQAQILNLLQDLKEHRNLAYLFISHDMSVVRYLCDRVAVMYLGRIVESAPIDDLFTDPIHPYTRGLLDAVPDLGTSERFMLSGEQGSPAAVPEGCRFRPRCALAENRCAAIDPPLEPISADRLVACVVQQERYTELKEHPV